MPLVSVRITSNPLVITFKICYKRFWRISPIYEKSGYYISCLSLPITVIAWMHDTPFTCHTLRLHCISCNLTSHLEWGPITSAENSSLHSTSYWPKPYRLWRLDRITYHNIAVSIALHCSWALQQFHFIVVSITALQCIALQHCSQHYSALHCSIAVSITVSIATKPLENYRHFHKVCTKKTIKPQQLDN